MKKTLKYQLSDLRLSIFTFFAIYLSIIVIFGIVADFNGNNSTISISSMDMAVSVYTFVIGIAIFKEHFWMTAQNGVSRKTFFKSCMCFMLILNAVLAILSNFFSTLIRFLSKIIFRTQFELSYPAFEHNVWITHIATLLFIFITYTLCFMCGYFIAVLFYKASKTGKVIIAAGLPIFVFFLLPLSAAFALDFWKKVLDFVLAVTGIASGNPVYGMITYAIITIILGLISYPLVKRTEI